MLTRLRRSLLRSPAEYLVPFEEALEDVVRNQDPKYLAEGQHCKVGLTGRCAPAASRALPLCTAHAAAAREDVCRAQIRRADMPFTPVRLRRSFGFHRVSPRELLSGFLGTLVQVEGIVTKCARLPCAGRPCAPRRRHGQGF